MKNRRNSNNFFWNNMNWPFTQISGFSQNLFFFKSVRYTHSRFNEQIQNTINAVPPRFCRRRCKAFHITWLTFLLTYELFLLETLRCTFWTKFLPFLIMHLSSVMTQYPEQRAPRRGLMSVEGSIPTCIRWNKFDSSLHQSHNSVL